MCRSLLASPQGVSARARAAEAQAAGALSCRPQRAPRWSPPWTRRCSRPPMRASAAAGQAGGPARGARAGPGSGSAGQSLEATLREADASEPDQALLAVSARLAAETRSPKLPRPR